MYLERFIPATLFILIFSCVPAKKYSELESLQKTTNDLLNSTTVKLNLSEEEKKAALDNVSSLEKQLSFLRSNNQELINNLGNLTTLSQKGARDII